MSQSEHMADQGGAKARGRPKKAAAQVKAKATEHSEEHPSQDEVNAVVRHHAAFGAAGGLIPLPAVDVLFASTVQLRMIGKLCDLYNIPFSEQAVKSTIGALVASVLPQTAGGYMVLSAAKTVPVFGQVLGMATMPALYGALTWALGRTFSWHFANGGTLENIVPSQLKDRFKSDFEASMESTKGN